jgi:hypothetical protein
MSMLALGVSLDHFPGLTAEQRKDGGRALAQLKQPLIACAILECRRKLLKLVSLDGLLRALAELLERFGIVRAQPYEIIVVGAWLGRCVRFISLPMALRHRAF